MAGKNKITIKSNKEADPTMSFIMTTKKCRVRIILLSLQILLPLLAGAQYNKLLNFDGTTTGKFPQGSLYFDGAYLYGATAASAGDDGKIYKINLNGTGYTTLLDFNLAPDGRGPTGPLISDGTYLFGMTVFGGVNDLGTIYKIKPDGTAYAKLYDFGSGVEGRGPYGSLLFDGTTLYGMTAFGGTNNGGTIFKILPNGTGYLKLFDFDAPGVNVNGNSPDESLIYDGLYLYGMTTNGGTNNDGVIFKILTDGTGYLKLHDFDRLLSGESPYGSLYFDGLSLYGMTSYGGVNDQGVIFTIGTDGTGFNKLLDFDGVSNGRNPEGSLFSDGTFLFGMTTAGGTNDLGTLFKIKPDGTGYVTLVNFDGTTNGSTPREALISDGTILYGATEDGGANGFGTLFNYQIPSPSATPTITSFTPSSGPVGTTITITGTNFSSTPANNIVYFGAVQATVTTATSTQLTVTVPTGATFKPITVSVNGLIAQAAQPFIVSFAGGSQIDNCSFAPSAAIGTTSNSNGTALCDLDGDAKMDLLIPERSNNQLAIFRNTSVSGTATFAPKIPFTGLTEAISTATGDLDGDGKPDIVVANYTGGQLSIYKNLSTLGNISVSTRVTYSIPTFTHDVSIADIDGDGKNDLIISTSIQGLIVMRNQGSSGVIDASTFATGITFAVGANAYPFALGDLDGDGKLDAVVPNANTYTLSVLRNTSTPGSVSFATPVTLATNTGTPSVGFGASFTSLGDVDGDGKLDIAAVSNTVTKLSLFRNTSTPGSLSFDPRFDIATTGIGYIPSFSDLNGDGKVELVADNGPLQILVFENTASSGIINAATFKTPITISRTSSYMLQLGDVDGDGRNDIISTSVNVQVFRNLVGTIFPPTITSFSPVVGVVGTSVTITGTNFITPFSNTVAFNGTAATITGSTATTLSVTVPVGATTGPIQITIGCNTITSSNFTVGTPATITIATQPTDFAACVGQSATFTTASTGTTNITYQWQFSTTFAGTYNDIVNAGGYSNASTASLSVNTTGNFGAGFYRCQVTGDFAPTVFSIPAELTVNTIPAVPTIGTVNLGCAPISTTLNPTGASAGEDYKFYDAATGGNLLNTGVSYTTPSLSFSTTYYISTFNTSTLCESNRVPALVSVQTCNPPLVATTTAVAFLEGIVTLDLEPLISDADNNLDPSTLQILTQPSSGALASLIGFVLTIDYSGLPFLGTDNIEIEICDLTGICAQQILAIVLEGEIEVFNAVSPNNDGKNDTFIIRYIELFPDTKTNRVAIYNRWGDVVFETTNYNNIDRVFSGLSKNDQALPSGTYFYKIEFTSGRLTKTGYLSLKR